MIVTCLNCNSNFKLDDNLVKPTGSTVRCSTCKHVFVIYREVSDAKEEVTDPEITLTETHDTDTGFTEGDLDLSEIKIEFDDVKTPEKTEPDLDIDFDDEIKDFPETGDDDDLDLSDIEIDFDDEKESAEDFDLPDMDTDFDLPDMDDVPDLKDTKLEEELSEIDLDEIAGDLDISGEDFDSDMDFDLSLDDDDKSKSDSDEKDKANFLDATDYDPDDNSEQWDVDNFGDTKKPKKRGCFFILLIMLVVAALTSGGIYFAVKKNYIDIDSIKLPDFINETFNLDKSGKSKLSISPYNSSNSRYIINKHEDNICVIEGKLTNNFNDVRKYIKVSGVLFYKDTGKTIAKKTVFCGNIIADIDLANLTISEINQRLNKKNGDNDEYKDGVKAGGIIPFMIVFSNLPEISKNRIAFRLDPASSNIDQ